jgi:hypothetical protein
VARARSGSRHLSSAPEQANLEADNFGDFAVCFSNHHAGGRIDAAAGICARGAAESQRHLSLRGDSASCKNSGQTFTLSQSGDKLEVKNEKGDVGAGW